MNCESFQGVLHEYLDESLDAETHAEARLHLQHCGACRRTLAREQAFAHAMHQSLGEGASGLSIRPGMRQDILDAVAARSYRDNSLFAALTWPMVFRPVLAAAALLAVGLVLYKGAAHLHPARSVLPIQAPASGSGAWVVDVPFQVQRHVFQRQPGAVLDSITYVVGGAYAGLTSDTTAFDRKPSPTPL